MMISRPALRLIVAVVLIASVALLVIASYFWVQIPFVKFKLEATQCKWGPPLAGVYLPGRLKLMDRCLTVSGTVDCLKDEPDGDVHIRLRLDPQYARLLMPANSLQTCVDQPGPHLVVEIIPQPGRTLQDQQRRRRRLHHACEAETGRPHRGHGTVCRRH